MQTIAIFNTENVSEESLKNFRHQRAVRTVIFDAENKVALLHAVAQGYYGLPGGGVDGEESFEEGAMREAKEETGCAVEIISTLGRTLEYREKDNLINESAGYVCQVIGEKGTPILVGDENEAEKGSVVVWMPLQRAIDLMKATPVQDDLYIQYCIERDLAFLETANLLPSATLSG